MPAHQAHVHCSETVAQQTPVVTTLLRADTQISDDVQLQVCVDEGVFVGRHAIEADCAGVQIMLFPQ